MNAEIEAKFYPVNKEETRKKLAYLGAKLIIPERLMIRHIADKRVNPNLKCDIIRIRDEGNLIRLSAKMVVKEGGKIEDKKEDWIEVSDLPTTIKILESTGLVFNIHQENRRETWEFDGTEVEIDSWPELEPFVEIEGDSEEQIKSVAEKLGLNWNNKVLASAAYFYAQKWGITFDEALIRIENISFEK